MENTSAYANILLKSSALTTSVAAAPKHDYENDDTSADFHQTFKNVHDSQKRQHQEVYKSANHKKSTQVERHSDVKNTNEIKDVKTTREPVAKQKPADDSTEINPDASPDALMTLNTPGGIDIGVTQSSLVVDTELTTAAEPAPKQETTASIEQAASPSLAKLETETSRAANTLTLETENVESPFPSPDASAKAEKSGELASQPLVVDESLLEKTLTQPLTNNVSTISVNQPTDPTTPADVQVLAAVTVASAASVKPLQPQVVLAEESTEVIKLPTSLITEAAASAKIAPAGHPNAATSNVVNPEVTTAQVQMNASKTAFEKTLQAIVLPDASGADDLAALATSSSSTSSSTNPSIDSLMRGLDQQTPAARSFVVQTAVPVPVGQPQWSQAIGEKVLWLAAQNVSSAEINLHPKDLGPIQVRVSVNQEQTTVSFTSQHAVVREVLDQNLNRLRDMFSEQGLNLVNVDVSDKSFSRQQGESQGQKGQGGPHDIAAEEETAVAMSAIVQQRLVDHYA